MAIIVKSDYNTALKYKDGNVSTKYNNKKQKVFFLVFCDDAELNDAVKLAKNSSNIVGVVHQGLITDYSGLNDVTADSFNIVKEYTFGDDISEMDIVGILEQLPSNITPVVILQDTFKDLRRVYDFCSKYDRVRFTGGLLFPISGVRLGYCSEEKIIKRGMPISNTGLYEKNFEYGNEVVNIAGLEFTVSAKAVRSHSNSGGSSKSSAPKKFLFSDFAKPSMM